MDRSCARRNGRSNVFTGRWRDDDGIHNEDWCSGQWICLGKNGLSGLTGEDRARLRRDDEEYHAQVYLVLGGRYDRDINKDQGDGIIDELGIISSRIVNPSHY